MGQSGTGKTTLAREIISEKRNLIIIDPKHQYEPERKHVLVTDADELTQVAEDIAKDDAGLTAILYRPAIEDLEDAEEVNRVFLWIFKRQNTFVYIDEATGVCKSPASYPFYLRALYVQGRGRGIGVLSATQRPVGLPGFMFSECESFWKFFLLKRADQEKVAEFMGDVVLEPRHISGRAHQNIHTFFYRNIYDQGEARQYILDTGKAKLETGE